MNILSLETSTRKFSIAVSARGVIKAQRSIVLKKVLSASIIPAIERILRQVCVPINRIDGFAVGLGPGSFTSLRVGLATVKGLAFATGKPVVGISSLDVLAMNAPTNGPAMVCPVVDAKRGLLYWCLYERKGGKLARVADYSLTDGAAIFKKVRKQAYFTGDGVMLLQEAIAAHDGVSAPMSRWYPHARVLAALAERRFVAGDNDAVETLAPLYLYPDYCQVAARMRLEKRI